MNTIRRLFLALLSCIAASCGNRSKPSGDFASIDPNKILFSLPTICDPAPAVDPIAPPAGAKVLHEDDWRQIEFVAAANQEHINHELKTLIAFKNEHNRGQGWAQVYNRKEHPVPLATLEVPVSALPKTSMNALAIGGGPPWGGTVRGGFALDGGREWFIYGQHNDDGKIVNLAIQPGQANPGTEFVAAIINVSKNHDLLLVDWYATKIVDTSSSESVVAWAARYESR
jgi:hypothetical protein